MKLGIKLTLLGLMALPSAMFADDMKACTMIYAPVCAKVQVQCIKAPCDAVYETFGSQCTMESNSLAEFAYNGECTDEKTAEHKLNNAGSEILDRYFAGKNIVVELQKIQILSTLEDMIQHIRMVSLMTPEQSQKVDKVYNMINAKNKMLMERYIKDNISTLIVSKPVTGSKWYVTTIVWNERVASVNYSDGTVSNTATITITFDASKLNPTVK